VITVAEDPRRERRFLTIALIASIAVHLIGALFYFRATDLLAKVHVPFAKPPEKEVVTLSSAIRLDKRPKPVPVARPKSQPPRPRSPQSPPNSETLPQLPAPSNVVHELAKSAPSAPPNPTPLPTREPTSSPEKRVAALPRPRERAEQPRRATLRSHLSTEEIARIENDLSRTIAQARSDANPLAVPRATPGSSRRYKVQMLGALGDMRSYQGICDPIREPWRQNGNNYYYVACNVQFSDGTFERQAVPWPIHFAPNRDPFQGTMSMQEALHSPLPGPEPGWKLPPGETVSKELRQYAHERGVDI
jgi:hypothetical protein